MSIRKKRIVRIPTFWKRSRLKILQLTVSAVFTDPDVNPRTDRRFDSGYAISPSVRVRKEAFGLLFYNTEESRLTFVKSEDLLRIVDSSHEAKRIAVDIKPETQVRVRKLLDHLLKKRLIRES